MAGTVQKFITRYLAVMAHITVLSLSRPHGLCLMFGLPYADMQALEDAAGKAVGSSSFAKWRTEHSPPKKRKLENWLATCRPECMTLGGGIYRTYFIWNIYVDAGKMEGESRSQCSAWDL